MTAVPYDGHSTGPSMLAVTWVFTGISTIIVSLKIWTRIKIIGQTGLDDVLTVVALVCALSVILREEIANLLVQGLTFDFCSYNNH